MIYDIVAKMTVRAIVNIMPPVADIRKKTAPPHPTVITAATSIRSREIIVLPLCFTQRVSFTQSKRGISIFIIIPKQEEKIGIAIATIIIAVIDSMSSPKRIDIIIAKIKLGIEVAITAALIFASNTSFAFRGID